MFLEPCSKEQLQNIYDEFQITEDSLKKDADELKKWLKKQPHLPNCEDEDVIRSFHLRCKNDMERTKSTLELYYTTKAKLPELFTNRDLRSTEFKKCLKLSEFVPLPKLTPEGYRVSIFRINGHLNEKMPSPLEYVKTLQCFSTLNLKIDLCKKNIIICDFTNISLAYCTLLLMSLRRLLSLSTKVIPYRYHKIYVMNAIPAVGPIISLAKKLAKKEVGERIEIWKKGPSELAEVLPSDILPSDYGGTGKSFEELFILWSEELEKYNDWLTKEEKDVADLSKKKKSNWTQKIITSSEPEISLQNLVID